MQCFEFCPNWPRRIFSSFVECATFNLHTVLRVFSVRVPGWHVCVYHTPKYIFGFRMRIIPYANWFSRQMRLRIQTQNMYISLIYTQATLVCTSSISLTINLRVNLFMCSTHKRLILIIIGVPRANATTKIGIFISFISKTKDKYKSDMCLHTYLI